MIPQPGFIESGDAKYQRIAGRFNIHGEHAIVPDCHMTRSIGINERHPTIARMQCFENRAIRPIDHAFNMSTYRMIKPS